MFNAALSAGVSAKLGSPVVKQQTKRIELPYGPHRNSHAAFCVGRLARASVASSRVLRGTG